VVAINEILHGHAPLICVQYVVRQKTIVADTTRKTERLEESINISILFCDFVTILQPTSSAGCAAFGRTLLGFCFQFFWILLQGPFVIE